MYDRYFGFNEPPFSISPNPDFLYMSEMHQDALAHLNHGVSDDGCITLLTGGVGTGKTTICRCFLEQLDDTTDVAVILNPKLKAIELLAAICDEFRISIRNGQNGVKRHIDKLNRFLLDAHARNRRSLLIIDEAQNLDKDVLEMVRLLTNLETSRQKLLKIFLLGQSELSVMLARHDMRQISQRITGRFHLGGLNLRDVHGYIQHRITVAGGGQSNKLFAARAVREIYRLSGGIPRLINKLCDRSLLGAYVDEKGSVSAAIVRKAARELALEDAPSKTPGDRLRLALTAVLAILLMVTLWVDSTADHYRFESDQQLTRQYQLEEQQSVAASDQDSAAGTENTTQADRAAGSERTPMQGNTP